MYVNIHINLYIYTLFTKVCKHLGCHKRPLASTTLIPRLLFVLFFNIPWHILILLDSSYY